MRDDRETPRLQPDARPRHVTVSELWAFLLVVIAGIVAGCCVECADVLQAFADTFPWRHDG